MQPYQEAGLAIQQQGKAPIKALGAIGSSLAFGKITSLLSKFMPSYLAAQGLSKIDPRLGKFIETAQKNGYSLDNALDILRQKANMPQDMSPLSPENIDIRYPNLFQFIDNEVDQGRTPLEAAGLAKIQGFDKDMTEIESEMKMRFSDLIEQMYAGIAPQQKPQQAQQPVQAQQQAVQAKPQQAQQQDPLAQALFTGDVGEVMKLLNVNHKHALNLIKNFTQNQPQQQAQAPQQAQSGQGQASQDLLQAIMAAQAARQRRSQ